MKPAGFQKNKRLVSNEQFKAVLKRRLCVSDELLILYVAENKCGYPRLGISIAKALGNAVERNRIKRLLRESFRQTQREITGEFDYLVMVSPRFSQNTNKAVPPKKAIKLLTLEKVKNSFLALAAMAASKST